jgi:hypothetical protein
VSPDRRKIAWRDNTQIHAWQIAFVLSFALDFERHGPEQSAHGATEVKPEESKVKLKRRVISRGDLKKRGASRVARFLHLVFKEQAPPQAGEGSLLRWFWSFTGVSRAVAAPNRAAIVVCAAAA